MTSPLLPPELLDAGARCGALLKERGQTVAVGEGSAGGLMAAALLAVPGASSYFLGAGVIYTHHALRGMLTGQVERPEKLRGASEPWATYLARAAQAHMGADWAIGEGGAAGPSGNAYGDPAGHVWLAVVGPGDSQPATRNLLTGSDDRVANMVAFATAGLDLLAGQLAP
ncbi:MAG: CinA family protein [Actinomycetota bacterium]